MEKRKIGGLTLWNFSSFPNGQVHFVTGRKGGVSPALYASLNMSLSSGDQRHNVYKNRALLAESMAIPKEDLIFVSQCHSDEIIVLEKEEDCREIYRADALVTSLRRKCICVMGADCVPILIYDPIKEVIAAVHAGWRGTCANIISKTISLMIERFGTTTSDIWVGIGPSISQQNYEVGEEVYAQFSSQQPHFVNSIFIAGVANGKYFLDLWKANQLQAIGLGVPEKQIEIAGICTYNQNKDFFSARYMGNSSGRLAAGIFLV